jgi:hypothetical protein
MMNISIEIDYYKHANNNLSREIHLYLSVGIFAGIVLFEVSLVGNFSCGKGMWSILDDRKQGSTLSHPVDFSKSNYLIEIITNAAKTL